MLVSEQSLYEYGNDKGGSDLPKTAINHEYSSKLRPSDEPYYLVNDGKNGALYAKYKALADAEENVIFGGRLGKYKYYDVDAVIVAALDGIKTEPVPGA